MKGQISQTSQLALCKCAGYRGVSQHVRRIHSVISDCGQGGTCRWGQTLTQAVCVWIYHLGFTAAGQCVGRWASEYIFTSILLTYISEAMCFTYLANNKVSLGFGHSFALVRTLWWQVTNKNQEKKMLLVHIIKNYRSHHLQVWLDQGVQIISARSTSHFCSVLLYWGFLQVRLAPLLARNSTLFTSRSGSNRGQSSLSPC